MKNYRLKPEAVPFFNETHATTIQSFDYWERIGVDKKALEIVEDAYVEYGHKTSHNSKDLAGWGEKDGSHFHFTIKFPSVKFREHDEFSKGKMMRELMNKIQSQINFFYQDFVNEEGGGDGN
jgi:hypothetical protein